MRQHPGALLPLRQRLLMRGLAKEQHKSEAKPVAGGRHGRPVLEVFLLGAL
jgi:hypothetical protein